VPFASLPPLARVPAAGRPKLYVFSEVDRGVFKHLFFAQDEVDELPMSDEGKDDIRRKIADKQNPNWQRLYEGE
jgi:hypothetical protein